MKKLQIHKDDFLVTLQNFLNQENKQDKLVFGYIFSIIAVIILIIMVIIYILILLILAIVYVPFALADKLINVILNRINNK
jgi:hypothetical protein